MNQTLTIHLKGESDGEASRRGTSENMNRRRFIGTAATAGSALGLMPEVLAAEGGGVAGGRRIKIGLIGCGSVSGSYIPELKRHEFIDLVSVCDIIPERAKARAEKFGVPNIYPHIDAMLAGVPFDLLVNTTSMPSHYPVNKKALEAKRHVWSEKPMGLEVAQGRELLELARKNGVRFWAAPNVVTSPEFKLMAQIIASGKIGPVTAAHGTYGHNGPHWSAWFYEKGGGSLYDLGVYNVTTLTGLLGPVKEVVGMTAVINSTRKVDDKGEVKVESDENTMLIMHHGKGVFSHVQTGFVYFPSEHLPEKGRQLYTIDIMGTNGSMHLQGWDWGPGGLDTATWQLTELQIEQAEKGDYRWQGGATYVAQCLLEGKEGLITPEHGLHVLEVMNACHESQRTGRRVTVESTFKWPLIA